MRLVSASIIVLASLAGAGPALAQPVSHIDAINSCEAFVESALRPEIDAEFKRAYKVICYFGLIDPQISENTQAVCARVAGALAGAHSEIANFTCRGAYRDYRQRAGAF